MTKRKILLIVEILIVFIAGIFIVYTLTKSDRMLDKYASNKDFPIMEKALKEGLAMVKKNPHDDAIYFYLAQSFYKLQGYDDALWALNKAITIAPTNSPYITLFGKIYQTKKDYVVARDAYIKALELDPSKVYSYTNLAWVYYFRLPDEKDKAFDVLKKGLEKFPNDRDLLFDIVRYYMYDQNKKEFLKYAPRYIKIDSAYEPINKTYKEWRR